MSLTSVTLQDLTPANVLSVYSGRARACCCGCSGHHTYSSTHWRVASEDRGYPVTPEEVNDSVVTSVLRTVQSHESAVVITEPTAGFVGNVSVDVGARVYMVYLVPGVAVFSG
jgi:hypothetical protein